MKAKTFACSLLGIAAGGMAFGLLPHFSRETIDVTVQDVREGVIVTDKGEFENTWSAWEWKFSPYDIKKGQKYVIGVYGWEGEWPLDWHRNIIYAEEIN